MKYISRIHSNQWKWQVRLGGVVSGDLQKTVEGGLCVSLLLEQIVVDGLGLPGGSGGRTEETTWVEKVQGEHHKKDHGTVHSVEVELGGDDPALPTVDELDGSVNGPDIEGEGGKSRSEEGSLHILVHEVVTAWRLVIRTLEWLVGEVTVDELDGETHVEGDSDHLEDDTAQHDSTTLFWILVITGGDGGEGTTDTLNGEGDEISGEEYDRIWRWGGESGPIRVEMHRETYTSLAVNDCSMGRDGE